MSPSTSERRLPVQLEPGDRLGPYAVVSFIARGAMSEVYRAMGPQGLVALKVPRRPAFVRHLRREGVLLARVEHPNVARVLDASPDLLGGSALPGSAPDAPEALPWIALELVEGQPLRALCRGTLPPAQATLLADQILAGLGAIHRAGVLHLDLKPENVIVQENGQPKLVDLGLGRAVTTFMAEVYLSASLVSRELPLAGTLAYMPPEQRRGQSVDARADLYAFGVLLHELLSGQLPDPATRLSRLRTDLTPRWDVAIAKLTHPEAAERAKDADEARRLVAFTLAEKNSVPVARGGHEPRDLSLADDQALGFLSPWVAGMVVGGCELIEPLGRGGFGEVWRARRGSREGAPEDALPGETPLEEVPLEEVAVKLALREEARDALRIEAAAAARIAHPGVPRVLADCTGEEPPCVVLELVEGTSLRLLINEEGKIPLADGLRIFTGMVELVQACHAAGVVHGDIKPEHFLVAPALESGFRRVSLIDFGLARLVGHAPVEASLPTHATGEARGTYDYMAPELRRGQPGGAAADVFALGVCLFEVVADYLPRGPQRLKTLRPEVPDAIDALALAMMNPDPPRRPTLAQVREVLRETKPLLGLRARPFQERGGRERGLLVAVVAAVLAVPLVFLSLTAMRDRDLARRLVEREARAGAASGEPRITYRPPAGDRIADPQGALSPGERAELAARLAELGRVSGLRVALLVAPLGPDPGGAPRLAEQILLDWARSAPPAPQLVIACAEGGPWVVGDEARQLPGLHLPTFQERLRRGERPGTVLEDLVSVATTLLAPESPGR